jgi:hypothetical protein
MARSRSIRFVSNIQRSERRPGRQVRHEVSLRWRGSSPHADGGGRRRPLWLRQLVLKLGASQRRAVGNPPFGDPAAASRPAPSSAALATRKPESPGSTRATSVPCGTSSMARRSTPWTIWRRTCTSGRRCGSASSRGPSPRRLPGRRLRPACGALQGRGQAPAGRALRSRLAAVARLRLAPAQADRRRQRPRPRAHGAPAPQPPRHAGLHRSHRRPRRAGAWPLRRPRPPGCGRPAPGGRPARRRLRLLPDAARERSNAIVVPSFDVTVLMCPPSSRRRSAGA